MKLLFLLFPLFILLDVDKDVPKRNLEFIKYLEHRGATLAPNYSKANCVEFLDHVLTEYINIDEKTSDRIYIKQDILNIEKLLKRGDSTIVAGVCWALVASGKAEWVKQRDVKRGDLVQYWNTDSFINGHCGVVYDEDNKGYILLSSHPDSKGYGKMNVNNKLSNNFIFFFVRLK
jgi:hypothetical protein